MTFDDVQKRAEAGTITAADEPRIIELVGDALAEARRLAPCLATSTDVDVLRTAKAIVCRAVLAASTIRPGVTYEQYPEYGYRVDSTTGMFTSDQEDELRGLCSQAPLPGVFEMTHPLAYRPMGRP
ncbi:hypothetical protein ACWEV3_40960 [Saccharopolyspora sp. NPDC003752]